MGKLTELLKTSTGTSIVKENSIPTKKIQVGNSVVSQSYDQPSSEDNNGQNDELFDLTEVELEQVRNSVVEIDKTDKDARQIIIGMFGGIKNPRTGKRFVIPGIDYATEDYVYAYAKQMRILVSQPEQFKKIMNWE